MNIKSLLGDAETIAITGHIRPDGDCVGSCMGLYNYLKDNFPQKTVKIFLEKPGEEFGYINRIDEIISSDCDDAFDLFMVLDCGAKDRFEPFARVCGNSARTVCIDHHISNESFADIDIVMPDASSTCEVLFGLLDEELISKSVAECIYTGIIHDTGVFKYSCTSRNTMTIAGKMMEKGIDYSSIIDNSFYKKTYVQNQILGRALLESILFYNGLCIFTAISRKEMEFYGVDGKQMGGIVEQLRLTDGVEVAIFMYEINPMEYKVSMRSKQYIDVSRIARTFGGGGHIKAAGFNMCGSVHDIINNISAQLVPQFEEAGIKC
ncbi:MAG: bifunctional oligoribonuclease/PAP phosphatase NrnA [Lachnospiraceae bacterium]